MNATRALTKRLKSRKEKTAWSAGRVQTPTLAMLVDREFEILAHVPRPYWRVIASFEHDGQRYEGTWFDPGFEAGDDRELRDDRSVRRGSAPRPSSPRCAGQAGHGLGNPQAVAGVGAAAVRSDEPAARGQPPLRLVGAPHALSAAQRCYERHKILTYPRTDSRCLPEDYRAVVDEVLAAYAGAADGPGPEFAEYAAAAAQLRRHGLQNEGRTFDDAERVRPLRHHPDGDLAVPAAHRRRQAPLRSRRAALPRGPSTRRRRLGAPRAGDRRWAASTSAPGRVRSRRRAGARCCRRANGEGEAVLAALLAPGGNGAERRARPNRGGRAASRKRRSRRRASPRRACCR